MGKGTVRSFWLYAVILKQYARHQLHAVLSATNISHSPIIPAQRIEHPILRRLSEANNPSTPLAGLGRPVDTLESWFGYSLAVRWYS